jgi:hypothetical protein
MVCESVTFSCKSNVSVTDLEQAINEVYKEFWLHQEEFVDSYLMMIEKNKFYHIMFWENQVTLNNCLEKIIPIREQLAFFDLIEPTSVKVKRTDVLQRWIINNIAEMI